VHSERPIEAPRDPLFHRRPGPAKIGLCCLLRFPGCPFTHYGASFPIGIYPTHNEEPLPAAFVRPLPFMIWFCFFPVFCPGALRLFPFLLRRNSGLPSSPPIVTAAPAEH